MPPRLSLSPPLCPLLSVGFKRTLFLPCQSSLSSSNQLRVGLVYWSLTIPLNGCEGWQDLGKVGVGVSGGLQLGKGTPRSSGCSGLLKNNLITRSSSIHYLEPYFFLLLSLILPVKPSLVTWQLDALSVFSSSEDKQSIYYLQEDSRK